MLVIRDSTRIEDAAAEIAADLKEDILKLTRQYRMLKEDRKGYVNETQHTLAWQGKIIADLMQEQENLFKGLRPVNQRRNVIEDKNDAEKLMSLVESESATKLAIKEENSKLLRYEDAFTRKKQEIEKLSKAVGFKLSDEDKCIQERKRIRILENRIEHSVQRFDKTLARNAKHRQNIELITTERKRYSDLHKNLEKAFKLGCKEKASLIQSSQTLFASREEAEHRMKFLTEKAGRDRTSYHFELKDLMRIVDNDRRLRKFMATKVKGLTDVYDQNIEASRKKRAANNLKFLQHELEYYNGILARLMEVSGLDDVSEMVERYIATEDQNFALFNFVNDQELQRKELQDDIESLKAGIVRFRNMSTTFTTEKKKILAELEKQFDKITQTRKANNKEDKRSLMLLEGAKKTVWKIYHKMDCNSTGFSAMLAELGVTESNMVQFLGVIENKANELLHLKLLTAIENNNDHEINLLGSVWTGEHSISELVPLPSKLPESLNPNDEYPRESQKPITNQKSGEASKN